MDGDAGSITGRSHVAPEQRSLAACGLGIDPAL
jgi:hypothetical protein